MNNYYVYVYIDPRNFEEFYYGKGKDSRKESHLNSESNSAKSKRIAAIKKEGFNPIIRVIASNLSEEESFLIEATLLWKLGKYTDNVASGRFVSKFRKHDTMHLELSGFDFQNGIYYYNVGEGPHRNWDDYKKYGFISGGQGIKWRDAMMGFQVGDIVIAYLKKYGFVGVGQIKSKAEMIKKVTIDGKPLLELELTCKNMSGNMTDKEKSEYVCLVKWFKVVKREEAKWKRNSGLYTTTHVRASLDGQPNTIKFIEENFGIKIRDYAT
jgi:hypothetical protein